MQFVHIGDNHLGYRQYNLDGRENDIYNAFNQCIDKIIEIKPDFVVHSGDLFDSSEPSVNALYTAIKGLRELRDHGIPIYIIHGNHDIPKRSSKSTPFLILKNILGDYLKTFFNKKYHIFKGEKEVFIGGSDFTYRSTIDGLLKDYALMERESKNYKNRIVLFHQSIYSYSNIPIYEIQLNDLPQGFKYYAGGHIHQRILKKVNNEDINGNNNDGVLAYSGSTEIINYDEYEDYEKNGKGFYLIDLSGKDFDINDVDKINIKCRDFIINKNIKDDKSLMELIEELETKSKPVVICSVVKGLLGGLEEVLKNKTLYNRISHIPESTEGEIILNNQLGDSEYLFKEFLKERNYDVNFIYGIYREAVSEDGNLFNYLRDYLYKKT
ncbi:DNA repair exonuclease [Methanothermococcus sp. SCGC AD-155-M21]|nr:DNA repair exonuclease [Methanothermococcus sp. SCGC AD-155-M21]